MIDRVVFDVKFLYAEGVAQTVRAHERRKTGIQADPRLAVDRQKLAITPQIALA